MSSVTDNYNLEGQNPLDVKIVSPNKQNVILAVQADELQYFRFYANMKIFFQQENEEWIWVEITEKIQSVEKLLTQSYTYPGGTIAYGFDYSGKTFNFIKYSDYLSVEVGINDGLISGLESEGVGVDIQNGLNTQTNNFKIARIASSNNSLLINRLPNGTVDFTTKGENIPYSQENSGFFFYKDTANGALRFLPLISTNISIDYLYNDGQPIAVQIKTPESGSSSSDSYFVDETYVPTATSQPDGSRARPFITLTDAVNARIGTGTRLNPNGSKSRITLLSNVRDSINPTINYTSFKIEGGKIYTYTGTNTYIFDYAALFDEAKIPGGPLSQFITVSIEGEGTITRSSGFGHIQVKNDDTYPGASALDPSALLYIQAQGGGLSFKENEGSGYVQLTNKDGTLLYNGGTAVYGANIAPITPMFNIVGASKRYWSVDVSGTQVRVIAFSQVAIRALSKGSLYEHTDSKIVIEQASDYIGYQTRDISGSEVYYSPYSTKNLVEILDGSNIQLDNLSFEPDGPQYHRSNSIIKLTNDSQFSIIKSLAPITHKGAVNFIEYSGISNFINLNNVQLVSIYTNFIKGDNVNSIELVFKNSYANVITNIYNQATVSTFSTAGTISSLASRYLITYLPTYENNSTASPALGNNVIYRTSDGTLKVTY